MYSVKVVHLILQGRGGGGGEGRGERSVQIQIERYDRYHHQLLQLIRVISMHGQQQILLLFRHLPDKSHINELECQ